MRVPFSLFGCLVFTACASLAFGQASYFMSDPVLGSPVLLGVDENQPGTASAEIADPVLGSVILIAAVSDSDTYQITTAAVSTLKSTIQIPTSEKPPGEIKNSTQDRCEIAIQGQGYFRIQMPDGEFRYTRRGSFRLDAEGRLVTPEGHALHPQIKIPADATSVTVGPEGVVLIGTEAQPTAANSKATLSIVRFANPKGLSTRDRILFAETKESGPPIEGIPGSNGFGTLRQGADEPMKSGVMAELIRWAIAR